MIKNYNMMQSARLKMHHLIAGMNFKKIRATNNTVGFDFIYIYKHEPLTITVLRSIIVPYSTIRK